MLCRADYVMLWTVWFVVRLAGDLFDDIQDLQAIQTSQDDLKMFRSGYDTSFKKAFPNSSLHSTTTK